MTVETVLRIESVYGQHLAELRVDGEVKQATVVLPGYADDAWLPVSTELRKFGLKEETSIALGPLLRFVMERREVPE